MLSADIYDKIVACVEQIMPEAFVVDLQLKRGKKSVLSLKVDTDQGISLSDCVMLSRKLGQMLDEEPFFDFNYDLEVSSPGVGTPLKLRRQYRQNIGRHLSVLLRDGDKVEGKLVELSDEVITLAISPPARKGKKGKSRKQEDEMEKTRQIRFDDIKEAKVIVLL